MELLNNPFFILGATMRDDRRRIMELAEEKSLILDEATVRDARAVLTNPGRRLAAEIGWLPGVGPKRIAQIMEAVANPEQESAWSLTFWDDNLPSLASANLLAEELIRVIKQLPLHQVPLWIIRLAEVHDKIEAEQTITLLNEERSVARFPAISNRQGVDTQLQERREYYRQAIKQALDQLPASAVVEVVTQAIDKTTDNGTRQAPILIDDLVDAFEVEVQEFFETETKTIADLVQQIRYEAVHNKNHRDIHSLHLLRKKGAKAPVHNKNHRDIDSLVDELARVVKNWDRVAQPAQLSARSRGTSHDPSHKMAKQIRSLAVELCNEHGLLDISRKLTALQQEVFAEVDDVAERLQEDASALDRIAEERARQERLEEARRAAARPLRSAERVRPKSGISGAITRIISGAIRVIYLFVMLMLIGVMLDLLR